MTAIAYRDGIMAADSVAWVGDIHVPTLPKINRKPDGTLIAIAGDSAVVQWFVQSYPDVRGADTPTIKENEFNAMIVHSDGECFECDHHLRPFRVVGPYHAIGAPFKFMLGALAAGATAEQAVRLAIEHTDGCGGHVQIERLHVALAEAAD